MTTQIPSDMTLKDSSKTERLSLRLDKEHKEKIRKAAGILGRGMTDFVVQTATEKAMDVINKHKQITLTEQEFEVFAHAVNNPGKPNEDLKQAKKRHDELVGE